MLYFGNQVIYLFVANGFQRTHNCNYGIFRLCLSKSKCTSFIPTSGMQRVAGVMEINSECRGVFIYNTAGHNEFIYLILGLFCFALSIPCGTQKWESVAARLT